MKNKVIIIFIVILSIFLVGLLNIRYNLVGNIFKLRADISYPTSNGVKLSCDKSNITVGETTLCTLTGYMSGGASGLSGKYVSTQGISINSVAAADGWTVIGDQIEPAYIYNNSLTPTNSFIVSTISITGVTEGNSTLKFAEAAFSDANDATHEVSEASYSITVGSSTPIEEPKSSDTSLKNVYVDYTPSFDGSPSSQAVTIADNMTTTLPKTSSSITIRATANDTKTTIYGDVDGTIEIQSGTRTFTIYAKAEDNTTKEYKLTVNNPQDTRSTINTLSALTVSPGTMTPNFNSSITLYDVIVTSDVQSVTISATLTDQKSRIMNSNVIGEHNIPADMSTYTITVKAENGSEKGYTINVLRQGNIDDTKSSDNTLEYIKIDGVKYSNLENINVETQSDKVEVIAKTNDDKATINEASQTGTVTLNPGLNTLSIYVTAENGSIKVYTFNVRYIRESITCDLKLSSSVYKVDNEKFIVDAVSKDHNNETIKKNLTAECGEITVNDEKVTLTSPTGVKVYAINRVWQAQTGQNVIKYTAIIGGILLIIGALIYIKSKISKE